MIVFYAKILSSKIKNWYRQFLGKYRIPVIYIPRRSILYLPHTLNLVTKNNKNGNS